MGNLKADTTIIPLGGQQLVPVARETLNDRVYTELRNSLIHGIFATGETLRIVDLAEKLKTSTMPVREALGRLVSEQALEALPNRSIRVPLITRPRLDDLSRARCMIEGQVTLMAMPNLEPADIATLRALTRQCELAFHDRSHASVRAATELNHAFHYHIYRAARSAVLIPVIESLWLQSGPFVQAAAFLHDEKLDPAGTHHHWEIINALEARNKDAVLDALTRDITRAFNLLRKRFDAEEAETGVTRDAG